MIPLLLFLLQKSGGYLAGAKLDWISQHSVFPDYFRKLYAQTGNLFPQYAAEIGGGQNIWNFAYYGLYNPLYLFSYLLPGVKMTTYLQVVSLLGEMANGILCYFWLKGHFKKENSFFASLFILLAAPMFYQSSTQIMFVSYMPFLLLTLIGFDRYKKQGNYGVMVCGVCCMILTSFYFSMGGLVALFFYGSSTLAEQKLTSLMDFIQKMWSQFYPVLFGIAMSMFYLVPVFLAMGSGRSEKNTFSIKELLLPDITITKYLYNPYGIGVTAIAIIAIVTTFFYKKSREKWMGIFLAVLLVCPLFAWALNGGLYIRGKCFIPFLPLICYLLAGYFKQLKARSLPGKWVLSGYVLGAALLIYGAVLKKDPLTQLLLLDLLLCGIAILITMKTWKQAVCFISAGTILIISFFEIGLLKQILIPNKDAQILENSSGQDAIKELVSQTESICRIETRGTYEENRDNMNRVLTMGQNLTSCYSSINNASYTAFRRDFGLACTARNKLMENVVDNPIFLRFMGVRYLVGTGDNLDYEASGYEKQKPDSGVSIYENKNVAPFAYVTNQTVSAKQYKALSREEKQLTLLESSVVNENSHTTANDRTAKSSATDCSLKLQPAFLDVKPYQGGEGKLLTEQDGIQVKLKKELTQTVSVNTKDTKETDKQYLFLSFNIDNQKKSDVVVWVNGQKNKLTSANSTYYNGNTTFSYTCPWTGENPELSITFGEGTYHINEIQCQIGTENEALNQTLYENPVQMSLMKSGDGYEGSVTVKESGYLVTSIPYDSNFQIYIDGKQMPLEKVNTAFLGAQITEGTHTLKIVYHAPGSKTGIYISLFAVIILIGDCVKKRWKRNVIL